MKKHYTIPFFITHRGCPFTCVFCRQEKISGRDKSPEPHDIAPIVRDYLETMPRKNVRVEAAFFGGSFTGLPVALQHKYLESLKPFLASGKLHGIRLSTRPDFIDKPILDMLKKYRVSRVELGVQSLSDRILKKVKRGHTSSDVREASRLILKNRMALGHQMMVGLPGSTLKDELMTAEGSIALGASEVRIYPVLVIKGTHLAKLWKAGKYSPLTEEEAVRRCAKLISLFESHKTRVIRCGLHPSEGLLSGKDVLAGPFHVSFRQKVETRIYRNMFRAFLKRDKRSAAVSLIHCNPRDAAYVIGHERSNAAYLEKALKKRVAFKQSPACKPGTVRIE